MDKRADFGSVCRLLRMRNRRYLDGLDKSDGRAQLKSQILEVIFDCVADGLIVFDENKTVVLANQAAAKIARWDLEDISREELHNQYKFFKDEGKTPLPIEEEPLVVAMRDGLNCAMEGYVTGEMLPAKGAWFRANAAPVFNDSGVAIGGVTIFHEISERRRLEKQRDCLTALIAHDIKNHLAAESSFLDLLVGMFPELDANILDFIRDLKRSSTRFIDMSNSLLEMSRAKFFTTEGYRQDIELSNVLQTVIEANNASAKTAEVDLVLRVDPPLLPVRGIPAVIKQVFHNIVQNAIEVSPKGTKVEIVLSTNPYGNVTARIIDHGPGLSAQEVESLFDPNRVASHVPKTSHSTGFGLYLSAMLIEGNGGTISCSSELGKGTTICVEFPRSAR